MICGNPGSERSVKKLVRRIKLKLNFLLYFVAVQVGATASDPLSRFCNDLEKAPDEVHIL